MIEICTVGGYSEVGKNMTAVKYKDDVVVLDMGLQVDKYIGAKDENEDDIIDANELLGQGAIPEEYFIKNWKKYVKAIIPTHAHLDHLGAIPYIAANYDADILCTPFSSEVLKAILKDRKADLPNKIMTLTTNAVYQLNKDIKIEFINTTHSTPQTVMVAVHTPEGSVLYCNDFKFDNFPVIGEKPNFKRLRELGKKKKVKLLILDSLYSHLARKTPSESIAREMLRDVMLGVPSKNKTVIVTTFASHIARLKSIVDFGTKMNRKIVFLGRSLAKYSYAAEACGIVKFSKSVEICGFSSQVKKILRKIEKQGRDKYLLVVTGHQGEPNAVLSKIVDGRLKFRLFPEDHVIFSCTTIPNALNIANRDILENKLKALKVRIFKDIHMSGHASREDHRDLIHMVNPEHIIPAHGDISKTSNLIDLAQELGYELGKTVHLMQDGQRIDIR
ncbi:RNase J family beta-CASP ribonuclease [Candidatus Woesearchaeota archaeon]|nr:RNase J family beta-CASP ribonuclease [Candidatus Woesearchaeota archaeon]